MHYKFTQSNFVKLVNANRFSVVHNFCVGESLTQTCMQLQQYLWTFNVLGANLFSFAAVHLGAWRVRTTPPPLETLCKYSLCPLHLPSPSPTPTTTRRIRVCTARILLREAIYTLSPLPHLAQAKDGVIMIVYSVFFLLLSLCVF